MQKIALLVQNKHLKFYPQYFDISSYTYTVSGQVGKGGGGGRGRGEEGRL